MPVNKVDELLRAASDPLCDADMATEGIPPGVCELLAARNGFFAFTAALHVRPSGDVAGDVAEWNRADGYPLAHDWQDANRPLKRGERLVPRTPFVIGGEYSVENLTAVVDHRAMELRGQIATQIAHLPEGAEIVLRPGSTGMNDSCSP